MIKKRKGLKYICETEEMPILKAFDKGVMVIGKDSVRYVPYLVEDKDEN